MARIPQNVIERELDTLADIVTRYPEGVGLAELMAEASRALGRPVAKRTLNRRLAQLVEQGRVRREGATRIAVYMAATLPSQPSQLDETAGAKESDYVPLSNDGRRIRQLVSRSPVAKEPVGYDRGLLERYQPGRTWYLPATVRKRLALLGATPDPERPAGTYAREIFDRLLIDLAWASSRLEGNTYSRLDTKNLLEFGQRASGKDATETQMILNHKAAIELLVEDADQVGFNRYTVLNLHAALSENLLSDPGDEGRLRQRAVSITGTSYLPLAIPQQIEQFFDLILSKAAAIPDPFEQSFFVMVQLPYLQPFMDVNKRTSRLAANIPLIKANLCPLSFVDVPLRAYVDGLLGVYELRRMELLRDVFVWAYERSCAQYKVVRDSMEAPNPFRLRYRTELASAVQEVVSDGRAPSLDHLRQWGNVHGVPAEDREEFAATALELLLGLHEHSAARYRLTPAVYRTWRSQFGVASSRRASS
jgi:hypothetical protein